MERGHPEMGDLFLFWGVDFSERSITIRSTLPISKGENSPMFNRKVRIFGKSVPVAIVILAIVATTAFAAWLIVVGTINANVSTATFDGVSLDSATIDASSTAACSASLAGSTVTVNWADARPGEVCLIDLTVANTNGPAILSLDKTGVPAEIILDDAGSDGMTSLLAIFAHYMVSIELEPVLSQPGTAYPFSFELQAIPQ